MITHHRKMKKDYVYQDKGQFKLLQNAKRIGGFYAGDQGIVPAERVLPEQRFAHQPIFRRPPEEKVTTFSYKILPYSRMVADKLKKKTTEAGVDLEYTFKGSKNRGDFVLKNWSEEAKAVPTYPSGYPVPESPPGEPIGDSLEGSSLGNSHWPVFFKNYVWFIVPDTTRVFYSKIKPNGYETKEIKVAFQSLNEQWPVYTIYFIYRDTEQDATGNQKTVYKMVVAMQTGGRYIYLQDPEGWRVDTVQYKADSLEGPWVYEKTWATYDAYLALPDTTLQNNFIQEFASLILSKSHNQLSLALGSWNHDSPPMPNAIQTAYGPPLIEFWRGAVQSRGKEGEIAIVPPEQPGYSGIARYRYLVKRLGNGEIQKTFITELT